MYTDNAVLLCITAEDNTFVTAGDLRTLSQERWLNDQV